jgi:hydrogenase maturation protease
MILLAGVGYLHLSDLSFGPHLVERLAGWRLPPWVQLEDLSYGPIAVVQWFQDAPGRFERAIFMGAIERGRPPGTLTRYAWDTPPRPVEEVQERVAEAVTGVISIENLLIIASYFGVLPARTVVIELEPLRLDWGLDMSATGYAQVEEALAWIDGELAARPAQ